MGIESLSEHTTEKDSRNNPAIEFLIGPTVNFHPTRHGFITVSPLFGVTNDSPTLEVFVAAGFHFDLGGSRDSAEERPAST